MNIIDYSFFCLKGDGTNRDRLGLSALSAWVMDGATELSDKPSLLPAYLNFVQKKFYQMIDTTLNIALPQILATIIEEASASFQSRIAPLQNYELPNASLALIRCNDTSLECLCLGDAVILIKQGDRLQILNDNRLEKFDRQVIERMIRIHEQQPVSVLEAREQVYDLLRANRSVQNMSSGYPVCGFDPLAASQALYQVIPLKEDAELLILSDGFTQIYSVFKLLTPEALFNYSDRLGEAAQLLRKAQDADCQCNRFPRLKLRDDASALYLRLGKL